MILEIEIVNMFFVIILNSKPEFFLIKKMLTYIIIIHTIYNNY